MSARKLLTLVFVRKPTEILLGMKKRGFGKGRWNGFGGKVEPGETILQGALRELKEECGLRASELRRIGLLEFEFEGDPTLLEVHVFETYKFQGEIVESEEMRPQWYDLKSIPFHQMWPDDSLWFAWMLRDEPVKGYFLFRGMDQILKHRLEKLDLESLNIDR